MKTLKYLLPLIFSTLMIPKLSLAQEQIAVPLSNPDQPGKLEVGIIRGSISVTGYDGQEVIIRYNTDEDDDNNKVTQDGLRRISDNSAGFEATENKNTVRISGASPMREINFEVSVPRNFSLYLSTVNNGDLTIANISGELELSNVNGDITLQNISGSALINTVNGDITATFNSVDNNKPMAFSNLNGDIDITFPADAKLTAKMRSEWGEVFTDFEMDVKRSDTNIKSSDGRSGGYKISVNNWIYGDINGGGPEYLFKSMRGDIYIRKK
jgi:hypothetical protein